MIGLTGKCRIDFHKWIRDSRKYQEYIIEREAGDWGHGGSIELSVYDIFDELPITIKNSIIVEFLDGEGFLIDRDTYDQQMKIWNYREEQEPEEPTIIECAYMEKLEDWWIEAIERTNRIYNETL